VGLQEERDTPKRALEDNMEEPKEGLTVDAIGVILTILPTNTPISEEKKIALIAGLVVFRLFSLGGCNGGLNGRNE